MVALVRMHVSPPGDIGYFLKTFLVLTPKEILIVSDGWSPGLLQEGMFWPQMSIVLRLGSSGPCNRKKKHLQAVPYLSF